MDIANFVYRLGIGNQGCNVVSSTGNIDILKLDVFDANIDITISVVVYVSK